MFKALASISALLASVALLIVGHGLQGTLLPLAAQQAAFSDLAIGLVSSAYFVGMVAGCLAGPFVIRRGGHVRAFAALVSLMSAAALLHPVFVDPLSWFIIRVISGFCLAGFYMIVESWLNEAADNRNRGMIMSFYIVVLYTAMMVGQISVSIIGIESFIPFIVASVMVSLAVIPLSLTTSTQPAPITIVRFRPVKLYQTSPAAFVGCLLMGLASSAVWTLSPIYGTQIGMTTTEAAYYAAAFIGGGVIGQWPFGRLSDRMDRRHVLLGLAFATLAIATAIALIEPRTPWIATLYVVAVGAVLQPAYSIAVAHAFDHAPPTDYVETSSGLLLSYGIGSIIGPTGASFAMQTVGPSGLYIVVAGVQLLTIGFIVTRLAARATPAPEDKRDFGPEATSPIGAVISPEPVTEEDLTPQSVPGPA